MVKQLEGFWMAGPKRPGRSLPQTQIIGADGKNAYAHWDSKESFNFIDQFVPALRDHVKAMGWRASGGCTSVTSPAAPRA